MVKRCRKKSIFSCDKLSGLWRSVLGASHALTVGAGGNENKNLQRVLKKILDLFIPA
jgi:hypothetical protein